MQTSPAAGKKRRGRPAGSRGRKRQKNLDSIRDLSPPPPAALPSPSPRRSSRPRHPPQVLDSSPRPSSHRRLPFFSSQNIEKKRRNTDENTISLAHQADTGEDEGGDWGSRLRTRVPKSRRGTTSIDAYAYASVEVEVAKEEVETVGEEEWESMEVKTISVGELAAGAPQEIETKRKKKKQRRKKKTKKVPAKKDAVEEPRSLPVGELVADDGKDLRQNDGLTSVDKDEGLGREEGGEEENSERILCKHSGDGRGVDSGNLELASGKDGDGLMLVEGDGGRNVELVGDVEKGLNGEGVKPLDIVAACEEDGNAQMATTPRDACDGVNVKEGRRCGLCGRGCDGRPPKRMIHELGDSENEVYNGLSAAEEPNYDVWDGFGDEPEWLGRLLGPIRDYFGIARVWVHQNCAVWSPEVYFAGLGCLKNVRAALCRGRALKCCRCGRPGATIGCRVDRCPKTYHLPCARADSSIFDHRKFLIACPDHRHLFQPRGDLYVRYMKKQKAKKLKLDMRKFSNEAHRRDFEAEEKWLENCGEDEEFLKRESKRLHRDILRIAPIYIGGSSTENNINFRGWESVAGLHDVIRCMKEVVILPLLYPEFFTSMGLTPPRGVLLHGHPGTGKTLVVRALIGECARGEKKIAYFARKGADCLGKYVGDAERQLRLLFQVAEKSQPSIIFFDEIDGLAPCRSKRQDQTHSSVVSTLLSLMDGLKSRGSVIVIGATNRPDAIDPALRRPGRFDREIYFPLPSAKDRASILSLHTKKWPKPLSEPILTCIVERTVGYAGADLQALCTQAAMIALKRNCPLHDILYSAEKGSCSSSLPHLPSIFVEERDWLAALSGAPPPCSQREAGVAANDIVSARLQYCLLPSLIHPLAKLLISLYLEEQIWLPPAILRSSRHIWNTIVSVLDKKNVPTLSWISSLPFLVEDPNVVREVERSLLHAGLFTGLSSCSYVLDTGATSFSDELESVRESPNDHGHASFGRSLSVKYGKLSGFRALISGTSRSGQHHLAACIIHGFVGHVGVQKINLATIAQEGHGDISLGLTQLLAKCFSGSRCVLYLPRIDLWAMDRTCQMDIDDENSTPGTLTSSGVDIDNGAKRTSQAWDLFVEQVDSACISDSLIVLATSEVPIQDLPCGVRLFFSNTTSNFTNMEHTIPRISVHVEGKVNPELLIDLAAAKLTGDLVQQYVQKLHLRIHSSDISGQNVQHNIKQIISKDEPQRDNGYSVDHLNFQDGSCRDTDCANHHGPQSGEFIDSTESMLTRSDPDGIHPNNEPSMGDHQNYDHASTDMMDPSMKEREQSGLHGQAASRQRLVSCQPATQAIQLAISSLGYQILHFPHFAELCWATSKLNEGPSADITFPVKSWPYNSCILRANNSREKMGTGSSTKNGTEGKNSGTLRGLLAVGLLAQRGVYTSVREVALEVRKVSDLFVGEVNAKTLAGKGRTRFHRILSQVAYLEDMVNNWAYALQSVQLENQFPTEVNKKSISDCQPSPVTLLDRAAVNSTGSGENLERPRESAQKDSELNFDHGNPTGNQPTGTIGDPTQAHRSPAIIKNAEVSNDFQHKGESLMLDNSLHGHKNSAEGDGVGRGGSSHAGGRKTSIPSIQVDMHDSNEMQNESNCRTSKESEISCLYDCCTECLHMIHSFTLEILTSCWQSKGCRTTVDDVMDIVASCSAATLASSLRCQISRSTGNSGDCLNGSHVVPSRSCCCKALDDDVLLEGRPWKPDECTCHTGEAAADVTGKAPVRGLPSKFLFRNNVLVPLGATNAATPHCDFTKLCLCCMVPALLKAKDRLISRTTNDRMST